MECSDGRMVCIDCEKSAVLDSKVCQQLFDEVCTFFEKQGIRLGCQLKVFLVDRESMEDLNTMESDSSNTDTLGITLSSISSVTHILNTVQINGMGVQYVTSSK